MTNGITGYNPDIVPTNWGTGGGTSKTLTPSTPPPPQPSPVSRQVTAAQTGLPLGIVPYSFGQAALAASQTALQLYRVIPAATPVGKQVAVRPPFSGSVVGLAVAADTSKNAGTATFQVYIDGVTVPGASLSWDNISHQEVTFATGTCPFAALAGLDVRVTTDGSFAPTPNLEVIVYLQQAAS